MKRQVECIAIIQNLLSIFTKDLAYILDEDRSIVYSYTGGNSKEVSEIVLLKLERLVDLAMQFDQLNIERIDSFLYREIVDGQTLIDYLKECTKVPLVDFHKFVKFINTIKTIADKEAATRRKVKGPNKDLSSLQQVVNEFSTPISHD